MSKFHNHECILCGHSKKKIEEQLLPLNEALKEAHHEMGLKTTSTERIEELNSEIQLLEDKIDELKHDLKRTVVSLDRPRKKQVMKKRTRITRSFDQALAAPGADKKALEIKKAKQLALIDGYLAYINSEIGGATFCSHCVSNIAELMGIKPEEKTSTEIATTGDKPKKTFADIAGAEEAKAHAMDLVEYLKDPTRLSRFGGKFPTGAIFLGPPGTGKTLMAKAIAGEAGCDFHAYSGSEFVEKYVGVGASRIREMFEKAKESAKKHGACILFIDEIDALGGARTGEAGGGQERENTLNELLVQMDGFDGSDGIIVIAATNRADMLDPALIRPGRLDRQITVPLPHQKARKEILEVHAKGKKFADKVELADIAARATGFSGAELANLLNEAAIRAAKKEERQGIEPVDVDEAFEKIIMGARNSSMILTKAQRLETAWHEAGHAIMGHITYLLKGDLHNPVSMVTILPRGQSLGTTWYQPEGERVGHSKNYWLAQLDSLNGGRTGELLHHDGDEGMISTGASSDVDRATNIALRMARNWLFGDLQLVEKSQGYSGSNLDEASRAQHTAQANIWVKESHARVIYYLTKHKDILESMVDRLMKEETLRKEELAEIFKPLDVYKGNTMKAYMEEATTKLKAKS